MEERGGRKGHIFIMPRSPGCVRGAVRSFSPSFPVKRDVCCNTCSWFFLLKKKTQGIYLFYAKAFCLFFGSLFDNAD